MSLDYDLTGISLTQRVEFFPPSEDGKMHNHLHNAIFVTIAVGIGQVTRLNYREFYMRQVIWCKTIGPLYNEFKKAADGNPDKEWTPIILTLDECRALVGLNTNASPLTRAQFNAKLWNVLDDDTKRPPIVAGKAVRD